MSVVRRLIVNADDFGLTAGVNRAVLEANERGILTSTTVLVNGTHAAGVEDARKTNPTLGFGIHVNFSRGAPCCDPSRVKGLVDSEGDFVEPRELMMRLLRRRVPGSEVFREVQAQIARLREFGVEPTHWDAHRSVAFLPGLRGPTVRAALDSGLSRSRTPRVWIVARGRSPVAARAGWRLQRGRRLLTDANRLAAHAQLGRQFTRPDWIASPNLVLGEATYAQRWRTVFETLPAGTVEVVSHPAFVDRELREAEPGLVDERAVDLEALLDPDIRSLLAEPATALVNFLNI